MRTRTILLASVGVQRQGRYVVVGDMRLLPQVIVFDSGHLTRR